MIELRRSSKLVAVAPRTPPTEPAKSVSPVKHSAPLTTNASMPSVWPGVCIASMRRPPVSTTSPSASIASAPPARRGASSACASTGAP